MVARQETLRQFELTKPLEIDGNPSSIGVALAIVGVDPSRNGENVTYPKLWTVKELKTKPATQKRAGQLSFPAETRKKTSLGQESLTVNMIAALVEEFSDDEKIIKNNLSLMRGQSVVTDTISVQNKPLDLVVLVYEGPMDRRIQPADREDVEAHGWISIKDLQRLNPDDLRNFVSQALRAEKSGHVISKVIKGYMHTPFARIPVATFLPKDFSIAGFREQRERQGKDVVGTSSFAERGILFESR